MPPGAHASCNALLQLLLCSLLLSLAPIQSPIRYDSSRAVFGACLSGSVLRGSGYLFIPRAGLLLLQLLLLLLLGLQLQLLRLQPRLKFSGHGEWRRRRRQRGNLFTSLP